MNIKRFQKWHLTFRVLPLIMVVIVLKLIAHRFDMEFISMNPLFSGIVTANIFLLGFLIAGVLSDYKESEKFPGDMAASIETIVDECLIIIKNRDAKQAHECLSHTLAVTGSILDWFHRKERTRALMEKISTYNDFFLAFESLTQANFIARLKQEQSAIRRMIIRIHTIRETSFVSSGYAIAEAIAIILAVGLIFVRIDPFYEALFFVSAITFLQIYMILLIKDLDNPFEYNGEKKGPDEVSLKPLEDLKSSIEGKSALFGQAPVKYPDP